MNYDPDIAPDATRWLETDDEDRLLAIRQYHERAAEPLGEGAKGHFIFHDAVETQLAEGYLPATEALERLMAEGLDRHDAIHAIGSVVAEEYYYTLKHKTLYDPDRYARQLGELTALRWRSG